MSSRPLYFSPATLDAIKRLREDNALEARRTGQDPALPAAPAVKATDTRTGATVRRDTGGRWLAWAGLGVLLLGGAVWWLGR